MRQSAWKLPKNGKSLQASTVSQLITAGKAISRTLQVVCLCLSWHVGHPGLQQLGPPRRSLRSRERHQEHGNPAGIHL